MGTMFGVPPPNSDPQLEGRHLRTPKERLESFVFAIIAFTIIVAAIAVVMRVL